MLAFSPLAAAPLADEGQGGLVANNIVAGAIIFPSITMFEEESFAIADITYGVPTVDNIAVSVEYNFNIGDLSSQPTVDQAQTLFQQLLTPDEINSGVPVIDNAELTFIYDFAATDITSGAVTIGNVIIIGENHFTPVAVSMVPIVDTLPLSQEHILGGDDIVSGVPTLPVRFLWDFQEIEAKTWTEVSDITDIWTDVPDPSDTWSDAA